ncbi:MAG: choice-of-anchor B family protein [Bacteroidales bacterium]|nr:choice-of-anchor B family protein [Bacteroidales bacterium]
MKYFTFSMLFFTMLTFGYSQQFNIQELGQLNYSEDLSDIWGWADSEGNEYALVGVYDGLSIVDVTDPSNPEELFFESGYNSIWRDIKTWDHYAYVSNEQNGGVFIVDLSGLPNEIVATASFTGSMYPFSSAHNLYIDETGKLYILGADNGNGGAIICDLTQDPMNPVELGRFDTYYLHDGMARGDTLWGSAIYAGQLLAIDVSDASSPQIMGSAETPSEFTHNAWVSDNGKYVFTTDEVSSGYIGAFDVTDLSDITEVDRIQTAPGSGVIPHNAHVMGDFLVTSYYTEGITIHDISRPENMIEVGHFDTSPNYSGSGYNGSWGAYPFLPSGIILASDIQEGLVVLQPEYLKAVYVDGVVTDSVSGDPLFAVEYAVIGTEIMGETAFDGTFSFGTLETGTFDLQFVKEDYETKIIEDVEFVNGVAIDLEVKMTMPEITGIDDLSASTLMETYPNPFTGEISIAYDFDDKSAATTLTVMDITGSVVEEIQIANHKGVVKLGADFPEGIYFVRFSDGVNLSETRRIVKL